MLTIVLLKVDLIWTTPSDTIFFAFLLENRFNFWIYNGTEIDIEKTLGYYEKSD